MPEIRDKCLRGAREEGTEQSGRQSNPVQLAGWRWPEKHRSPTPTPLPEAPET